jgi:hypothetical protein
LGPLDPASPPAQSFETDQRKRRLAPGLNLSRIATPSNGSDSTDSTGTSRRLTRLRTTLYVSIPGRHDQHRQQQREHNLGQALVAHSSEHGFLRPASSLKAVLLRPASMQPVKTNMPPLSVSSENGRYKKTWTPEECSENTDRTCPKKLERDRTNLQRSRL